jgi:protein-L-isoaspartate(D-aspartate) O-methyltransferase
MTQVDVEKARFNMIEQQIRPWDVLDPRVLDTMASVPREEFVPAAYRNLAFADLAIPLGDGEVMMPPKVEGRLLQALDVRPHEMVLEVGTGSGYLTALLARLAKHVYSVEVRPALAEQARTVLAAHGIGNVTVEEGDAADGWEAHAPYDVIALTGSVPAIPRAYLHSLRKGGRLFAIVGKEPVMTAHLVLRTGEDGWAHEDLFELVIPPLRGVREPQRFVF